MILKAADSRDSDIQQLEQLLSEAKDRTTRGRISQEIRNIQSGVRGEGSAAHFLNREYANSDRICLIHDLRIEAGDGDFAQIDHLIIHRLLGIAWVLETKNYAGRIVCDEHGDWTVWYGRSPQPIQSPYEQGRRHVIVLDRWLKSRGITAIREIIPVVLISPKSSINRHHLPPEAHIVKSDAFETWRNAHIDKSGILKSIGIIKHAITKGIDRDQLSVLGRQLCAAHRASAIDWRARFGLDRPSPVDAQLTKPPRATSAVQEPGVIQTMLGDISLRQLPDGSVALRHAANETLAAQVENACRGRGRWQSRYKNWIVPADALSSVRSDLTQIDR